MHQVWSVLDARSIRVVFEIREIRQDVGELRAFGVLVSNGKPVSFAVSALAKGLRSARLVRRADGSPPGPEDRPKHKNMLPDPDLKKTASDFRRTTKPKGLATASPLAERAFEMRKTMKIKDVARALGVSPSRVSDLCECVRNKRADELAMKATGS